MNTMPGDSYCECVQMLMLIGKTCFSNSMRCGRQRPNGTEARQCFFSSHVFLSLHFTIRYAYLNEQKAITGIAKSSNKL